MLRTTLVVNGLLWLIFSGCSGKDTIAGSSASQDLLNGIDQFRSSASSSSVSADPSSSARSSSGVSSEFLSSSYSATVSSSGISPQSSSSSSNNSFSSSAYSSFSIRTLRVINPRILTTLNAIQVPALNNQAVSLLQYTSANIPAVLKTDWNGSSQWLHANSGNYHIYTAATSTHHVALIQAQGNWSIVADGSLSMGTPSNQYKEFLAANEQGIYWVDYGVIATGGGGSGGGGGRFALSVLTQPKGSIYFQSWSLNTPVKISDSLAYRNRLRASSSRLVFVEYAPGATYGQVAVMELTSKQISLVSPSTRHQDRPAIYGDFVVWEEYLDSSNTVIRCKQLSTGQIRDVSSSLGFRTNPDIFDDLIVWEDQRSGNGDIWAYDLRAAQPQEQVIISGANHSAGARLQGNLLVWIESAPGNMGLVSAQIERP